MITPQYVKKFLLMMQSVHLDSKDVTRLEDCIFNKFNLGINQAHLFLLLNVDMVKNGKQKPTPKARGTATSVVYLFQYCMNLWGINSM